MKSLFTTEVGLFPCHSINKGKLVTLNYALLTSFGVPHNWGYIDVNGKWINGGKTTDINTIVALRQAYKKHDNYDAFKLDMKQRLQCFTTSAGITYKKKGKEVILHYNPFISIDLDYLFAFDIEEVKTALFDLPFVFFVSKSVSGNGIFALIYIEEPERLEAYAEHLFFVLQKYGLPVDTSKGTNYTDLRYVSYDSNMLFRHEATPLKIKRFNTRKIEVKAKTVNTTLNVFQSNSGLLKWATDQIKAAQKGQRFETVRRVAYAMGGHGCGLNEIKEAINTYSQFTGVTTKYIKVAEDCFAAGKQKPIAA